MAPYCCDEGVTEVMGVDRRHVSGVTAGSGYRVSMQATTKDKCALVTADAFIVDGYKPIPRPIPRPILSPHQGVEGRVMAAMAAVVVVARVTGAEAGAAVRGRAAVSTLQGWVR